MNLREFTKDEYETYSAVKHECMPPKIGFLEYPNYKVTVIVDTTGIHFYLLRSGCAEITWAGVSCSYQIGHIIAEKLQPKHATPAILELDFGIRFENAAEDDLEDDTAEGLIIIP